MKTYEIVKVEENSVTFVDGMKKILKPREKIEELGVSSLLNQELLAVILGSGSANKNVFELSEDIATFLENQNESPSMSDLLKISGLGPAKALKIVACLELSNRFLLNRKIISIKSPGLLIPELKHLRNAKQEIFVCVSLSSANTIINIHNVTIGLVNSSQIHPREAFVNAIEDRAVGVIFAHNHPSGSLRPSQQDIVISENLQEAGKILGIKMLDHLIISNKGWVSMKSEGFLPD